MEQLPMQPIGGKPKEIIIDPDREDFAIAIESPSTKQCKHCTSFLSSIRMQQHVKGCRKVARYVTNDRVCKICDQLFNSRQEVFRHIKDEHGDIPENDAETDIAEGGQNETEDESGVGQITISNQRSLAPVNNPPPGFPNFPMVAVNPQGNQMVPLARGPGGKMIKSEYFTSNYQMVHRNYEMQGFNPEGDPYQVTHLYICPICQGYFSVENYVYDHISFFHKIPMEHFHRLNLEIQCIDLANLKTMLT